MRIQGQQVNPDLTDNQLIEQLRDMSPALYQRPDPIARLDMPVAVSKFHRELEHQKMISGNSGSTALNNWDLVNKLADAAQSALEAEADKSGRKFHTGSAVFKAGKSYMLEIQGQTEQAADYQVEAADHWLKLGSWQRHTAAYEEVGRLTKEMIGRYNPKTGESYHLAAVLGQAKADETALRVEQGQVGFSADQPLGTDNIQDCLCLIIQNTDDKKTALAHIDSSIRAENTVSTMINHLGDGEKQAWLIGANHLSDPNSLANVKHLMPQLRQIKEIDFKGVSILSNSASQPSAICFYPATSKLTNAVPTLTNSDWVLHNAKALLVDNRDLEIAFDTTKSDELSSPFIDGQALTAIKDKLAKTPEYMLYNDPNQGPAVQGKERDQWMYMVTAISSAWQEEQANIADVVLRKIERSQLELNLEFSTQQKHALLKQTTDQLKELPIHIGAQAAKHNAWLYKTIETTDVKIEGDTASINLEPLHQTADISYPHWQRDGTKLTTHVSFEPTRKTTLKFKS